MTSLKHLKFIWFLRIQFETEGLWSCWFDFQFCSTWEKICLNFWVTCCSLCLFVCLFVTSYIIKPYETHLISQPWKQPTSHLKRVSHEGDLEGEALAEDFHLTKDCYSAQVLFPISLGDDLSIDSWWFIEFIDAYLMHLITTWKCFFLGGDDGKSPQNWNQFKPS